MNFKEFYEQVEKMKYDIQGMFLNVEGVTINYSKFDGDDCIWAMKGDKVISYIRW